MPETTQEQLTYPCLEDPFERHWIQDLAEDADRALWRIRSDINYVNLRPKAQIRRATGTTQSIANATPTTLTYAFTDFDNANPSWANFAAGTITPHLPGMYYADVSTRVAPASANLGEAYTLELRYNGATVLARKLGVLGTSPMKMAGLIPLVPDSVLPSLTARVTIFGSPGNVLFERSRLGLQFLARCAAPINMNPYFEEIGVDGWTPQGGGATFTQDLTTPFRGNGAGRLQGSTGAAVWSEPVFVTVGKRYTAQLWARRLNLTDQNHSIAIRWLTGAFALVSTSTGTNQSTSTSYQLWNVSAVAPATTSYAQIAFTHTGAAATIDTVIDDASLYPGCA